MDTLVSINQHKQNFFDFEMTVDGLNADDADVRFVIKYKAGFNLSFDCEHVSGSKWTVDIPPLKMLDVTSYTCEIEVIIDGYHFPAMKGLINVTGSPEVYIKTDKSEEKKEVKEVASIFRDKPEIIPTRKSQRTVAEVAKDLIAKKPEAKKENLIENKKPEVKKPAPKKVEKKPEVKKEVEKVAKKIIAEAKPEVKKLDPAEIKKILKESKPTAKKVAPKPVAKKKAPKPAPKKIVVVEDKKPELSEQDRNAKKIIESLEVKLPETPAPKKKILIKKGEQVTR